MNISHSPISGLYFATVPRFETQEFNYAEDGKLAQPGDKVARSHRQRVTVSLVLAYGSNPADVQARATKALEEGK